mmetsp:Transcript_17305/g.25887  ORF Transcript_17305/g.25887 Transcript_17305/m.25887 type:complete len:99 (-) Transcript_17305:534-830(-)
MYPYSRRLRTLVDLRHDVRSGKFDLYIGSNVIGKYRAPPHLGSHQPNEMALILHVVPLNQDTDTISTWRTVRDADGEQLRTISVLTKADLASKDGKGE